jgi:hypothetical protein
VKPGHWINLLVVTLAAGLLTLLALHWARSSYAEPACRRLADSRGLVFVDFVPPDPTLDGSHGIRNGECELRGPDGRLQTVSLLRASGNRYGAPPLVGLAMMWNLVFPASFVAVALILAVLLRAFKPGRTPGDAGSDPPRQGRR